MARRDPLTFADNAGAETFRVVITPGLWTAIETALWSIYHDWASEEGCHQDSQDHFSDRVSEAECVFEERTTDGHLVFTEADEDLGDTIATLASWLLNATYTRTRP